MSTFTNELLTIFRDTDVVGRFSGDEFSVLLTDSNRAATSVILSRLKESIEARNIKDSRGYDICYSVGCVEYEAGKHESILQLLADADADMYIQKKRK